MWVPSELCKKDSVVGGTPVARAMSSSYEVLLLSELSSAEGRMDAEAIDEEFDSISSVVR